MSAPEAIGEYFQKHVRGGAPTPGMAQAAPAFAMTRKVGVKIGNGSDARNKIALVMKAGVLCRQPPPQS